MDNSKLDKIKNIDQSKLFELVIDDIDDMLNGLSGELLGYYLCNKLITISTFWRLLKKNGIDFIPTNRQVIGFN